jgi:hypothetical protein
MYAMQLTAKDRLKFFPFAKETQDKFVPEGYVNLSSVANCLVLTRFILQHQQAHGDDVRPRGPPPHDAARADAADHLDASEYVERTAPSRSPSSLISAFCFYP